MPTFRDKLDKFKGRRWKIETVSLLGSVAYRSFAEAEWGDVEAAAKDRKLAKRLAIIHSACDPDTRQPLFTMEDMDYLGTLDSAVIDMLAEPALRIQPITEQSMKEQLGELAPS